MNKITYSRPFFEEAAPAAVSPKFSIESEAQYKERFEYIQTCSEAFEIKNDMFLKFYDKNRYSNVFSDDEYLFKYANSDRYINATQYSHEELNTCLLLTQGPLLSTVEDFWLMAFETNGPIVCLTNQVEGTAVKTDNYWENSSEVCNETKSAEIVKSIVNGQAFTVISLGNVEMPFGQEQTILSSTFQVTLGEETKVIERHHLANWFDGTACDPNKLVELIEKLGDTAIIHCSAGIGRSGAVAIAHTFIKKHKLTGEIPTEDQIDQEILLLRKMRAGCVQKVEQRKLISETIAAYINKF